MLGEVNRQGQAVFDEILNDPEAMIKFRTIGRDYSGLVPSRQVMDIYSLTGRGVRFTTGGRFLHFLEPPRI